MLVAPCARRPAGDFVGDASYFTGAARRGDVVCVEDGAAALLAYSDVESLPDPLGSDALGAALAPSSPYSSPSSHPPACALSK